MVTSGWVKIASLYLAVVPSPTRHCAVAPHIDSDLYGYLRTSHCESPAWPLLPLPPMLHSLTPCSSRIFQLADVLKTQPHRVHYSCRWLLLALASQPLPDTHCQHATVAGKLSDTGWVFQTGQPVERVQRIPDPDRLDFSGLWLAPGEFSPTLPFSLGRWQSLPTRLSASPLPCAHLSCPNTKAKVIFLSLQGPVRPVTRCPSPLSHQSLSRSPGSSQFSALFRERGTRSLPQGLDVCCFPCLE